MHFQPLTILTVLLLAASGFTHITVPGEHATIQAAVNVASSGDTIIVADGTYTGNGNRDIDFNGKNIVLRSENGPQYTIIDCEGAVQEPHSAFYLTSGEDTTAVIDGFTITGAYGPTWFDAAVRTAGASPTLKNCIITSNNCQGVRYSDATLHMYNCLVSDNRGYGVHSDVSETLIIDCEVSSNDDYGVFWQAQWYGHKFEMVSSLIRGNGSTGLYLLVGTGLFHVNNCTFVNNLTGLSYDWDFPKPVPPTQMLADVDTSTIENCILAYNSEYGLSSAVWAGDVAVRCNNAYDNGVEDYHEIGFGSNDEFGNISANPLFCDTAAGDFSISLSSPCAPENNDCDLLIGAFGVGCGTTGDMDGRGEELPDQLALHQNYPNPFNSSTAIPFTLPAASQVKLEIFNALGQRVAVLVDSHMKTGNYTFRWDAGETGSGTYIYRLQAGALTLSEKMILLK